MIRTEEKKNYFLNKYTIFSLSFLILLYAELIVRYTGISKIINILFIISPLILISIIYLLLIYKFSKELFIKMIKILSQYLLYGFLKQFLK